jgi:hypothetical protein
MLLGVTLKIGKYKGNFGNEEKGNAINCKKESTCKVFIIEMSMYIRVGDEADDTQAATSRKWIQNKTKSLGLWEMWNMVVHKRVI